ncbi:tetratricopeptide repeat protein [bacterium]|nr:tetratricopeptide repeat protein [bacterium]
MKVHWGELWKRIARADDDLPGWIAYFVVLNLLVFPIFVAGAYFGAGFGLGSAIILAIVVQTIVTVTFWKGVGKAGGIGAWLYGTNVPADTENIDFEHQRQLAAAMERRGDWESAIRHYKFTFQSEKNPAPEFAAYRLGVIYGQHVGRHEDAIFWLRKAAGIIKSREGEDADHVLWDDVQRELAAAMQFAGMDDMNFARETETIRAHLEAGRADEALAASRELCRRVPDRADSWFLAGLAEARAGRIGMAVEHYKRASACDPTHLRALFNTAAGFDRMERPYEAREAWRAYLDAAKDNSDETEFVAQGTAALSHIEAEIMKPSLIPTSQDETEL